MHTLSLLLCIYLQCTVCLCIWWVGRDGRQLSPWETCNFEASLCSNTRHVTVLLAWRKDQRPGGLQRSPRECLWGLPKIQNVGFSPQSGADHRERTGSRQCDLTQYGGNGRGLRQWKSIPSPNSRAENGRSLMLFCQVAGMLWGPMHWWRKVLTQHWYCCSCWQVDWKERDARGIIMPSP